eukprot:3024297-Rhodomonas_salina.1
MSGALSSWTTLRLRRTWTGGCSMDWTYVDSSGSGLESASMWPNARPQVTTTRRENPWAQTGCTLTAKCSAPSSQRNRS